MSHDNHKRIVYADNAATTSVHPRVLAEMLPLLGEVYGNPSSLHAKGREAKAYIDAARAKIAMVLGCEAKEIYFTGCGSESDNWAIKGAVQNYLERNKTDKCHIITTKIEHHAVLHTCKALEKKGIDVTYVGVDENAMVNPDDVVAAIREDTALVAIMYANNEVGTVEPIKEITKRVKEVNPKILVFTDAVQAVGHVPINARELGVDMLAFSGHKFRAPKGVGGLYIKSGVVCKSLVEGGGQEKGKRGGTENMPGIVGMAKALELANEQMQDDNARLCVLRDDLIRRLLELPNSRLTGHPTKRLPGTASFTFEYIEGESLLLMLDMMGICASTGSACSSKSLEPSHVLLAMGLPHEIAHGSLRLTLSHESTQEDVDYIVECVTKVVNRLREISPLGRN
ncbi:MAG: cysteine desulfurase NifS [Clostridia bacterium]|nr:cysteine desulfurase NifS [Clostridia bacterium]